MAETSALDVLLQSTGADLDESHDDSPPPSLEEGSVAAPDEPESSEAEQTEAVEVPKTLTVKELAEQLEIDPAEFYKTLQLDIGGEKVSLGEYKDRAKELAGIDVLKAQTTEQKQATEREFLEKNRALKATMQKLNVELTDDMVAEVNQEFEQFSAAEGQRLIAAKPEWQDPDKQRIGLDRIARTMQGFGFGEAEIQNSVDHRLRLAFDQLGELQELLKKAADSEVKQTRRRQTPSSARRRAKGTVADLKAAHSEGKIDTSTAVVGLIADGANRHGSNQS